MSSSPQDLYPVQPSAYISVHQIKRAFSSMTPEVAQALLYFTTINTLIIVILVWSRSGKSQRINPTVLIVGGSSKNDIIANRTKFVQNAKDMLLEGYQHSEGGFYYVPSPLGERLMIPARFVEELKGAPTDKVDFIGTFLEMYEGKYTSIGDRSTLHPRVVKAQLNQHLSEVMALIHDEIHTSFDEVWPACDEWTEVPVVDLITQVIARTSGRMLGGPTLARNQDWIRTSMAYAIDGFVGAQKLKRFPEIFKPLAARFIPEVRAMHEHHQVARSVATPLLEEYAANSGGSGSKEQQQHCNLLYWMSQQAVGQEKDHDFIASILLKISFAALHTSAAAPSQLIFDLCEHPEYIEPLREEYSKIMDRDADADADADADGGGRRISRSGYVRMQKMDSIMKESQRLNPLLLGTTATTVTFERIVTEDWQLSNGFTIPANTTIGVPAHAIAMDPKLYPDPERFDGMRFAKIRQHDPSADGRSQFVATNPASMAFGYGRHACPGRFFAANEIKAIMVHILENYDMKFKEGDVRPVNTIVETQFLPDHSRKVLFKKRRQS